MTESNWKVQIWRNSKAIRSAAQRGGHGLTPEHKHAYTARIDVEMRPREYATVYAGGSSPRVAVMRAAAIAIR